MRILLVTTTFRPDVGGVETMLTNLCQYLTSKKYRVDVITYNPLIVKTKAPFTEKLNPYITVHRIPWPGLGLFNILEKYPLFQFFYLVPALIIYTLFYLFFNNKKKYHIIHSFGLAGGVAGTISSKLFNIPGLIDICTVYRFPNRPLLSFLVKKLFKLSDYIRGNSIVGREEILKLGINPVKVGMITPPVDEKYFRPISKIRSRLKTRLPKDNFIVLFVARMVEGKNVKLAVNSTNYITSKNISFVFVGEGPLQNLVKQASKRDPRIIYKNNVSHHDLLYYYNSADILTCAAVDSKLLSFVGREALLCGLPILFPGTATYFGITYKVDSSLIPDNCGSIFKTNAKNLAKTINDLHQQYQKYHYIQTFDKNACRQYALKNFSNISMKWIDNSYNIATRNHLQKIN